MRISESSARGHKTLFSLLGKIFTGVLLILFVGFVLFGALFLLMYCM